MTCGIYILRFEGTSKVYIGQSIVIESRFTNHLNNLAKDNGKANRKMQNAYLKYGIPILDIACECLSSELDTEEQNCFELFDSINNGFNVADKSFEHGKAYPSDTNGRSKYSEDTYINIFKEIVSSNIPLKDIASNLGVHINTVYQIANGSSLRSTLEPKFPEEYKILLNKVGKRRGVNLIKQVQLLSPNNITYKLNCSIKEFAIIHSLNRAHLGGVINGKNKSHKGWKLVSVS